MSQLPIIDLLIPTGAEIVIAGVAIQCLHQHVHYIMDEKVLAVVLLHVDTNLSLHGRNRPNWFKSRPPFTNVIFIS